MDINDILNNLNLSKLNCDYCDVRIEKVFRTLIAFDDSNLETCSLKPSLGACLRVYNNGVWFYGATTDLNSIEVNLKDLISESHDYCRERKPLFENVKPYNESIINYEKSKASEIAINDKIDICKSYFDILKSCKQIVDNKVYYTDLYKIKYFKSSKNCNYIYDDSQFGLRFKYALKENSNMFKGHFTLSGHDISSVKDKHNNLSGDLNESILFINASSIKAEKYDVILSGRPVGAFAHESFGHKSEADFMIGDKSANDVWKIGSKVASECVSIVDDGSILGSSGYCPYDDEGTPAKRNYLIKNGVLAGRLHTVSTAYEFNDQPTGNARAMNFEFEPIVRMTNTFFVNGNSDFNNLVSGVEHGLLIKSINHGSGMSTFTLAPLKTYKIRKGKIAEPVKVSVVTGSVFETLNKVEACSNDFELEHTSFGGCGKMDQFPLPIGYGGPSVLVRDMHAS